MDKNNFDSEDSFVYREERPWPSPRLKTSAIIGHTTPNTAKIWFRTGVPGNYQLLLSPKGRVPAAFSPKQGNPKRVFTAKSIPAVKQKIPFVVADYTDDTTFVADVTGLKPDTEYQYWLLRKEKDKWRVVLGHDNLGGSNKRETPSNPKSPKFKGLSFKTMPVTGDFAFALFSCHNPFTEVDYSGKRIMVERMDSWFALTNTLRRHRRPEKENRLAFVIAGGDQAYSDGRPGISIWNYLYKVARKEDGKLLPTEATMLTWFRDMYRGYWGFPDVREVFANYPTYMVWDDHEIGDGWGSFDDIDSKRKRPIHHEIYAKLKGKRELSQTDATKLLRRMFAAAKEAYWEYEHCHNPQTEPQKAETMHYHFEVANASFFVLDGRGARDINRSAYRIHGKAQIDALKKYADGIKPTKEPKFLFVVSAVPLLHTANWIVDSETGWLMPVVRKGDRDDLRDGMEHPLHDDERKELKRILWSAAKRDIRVAILSGDVHASAAFRLEKSGVALPIYQLTSSAITYHLGLHQKAFAEFVLPARENGKTEDGERFTRLSLGTKYPYAIVQVNQDGTAVFQLYTVDQIDAPSSQNGDIRAKKFIRDSSSDRTELWK